MIMSQPAPLSQLALTYLTREPQVPDAAQQDRPPLLLLLHGVGSHEGDLFRFAAQADPHFLVLSVRAPLTRAPGSYAWFSVEQTPHGPRIVSDQLAASRATLAQFIREAVAAHNADPDRVYLLGFSQGAIMAMTLALTQPRLLAGVVAIAGRIPPEVLSWAVSPEQTAGLPLLLEHGRQDEVLNIDWAHKARAVLEGQQVALTYCEYDAPHRITQEMLADATSWLSARLDAPAGQPPSPDVPGNL
jgi:phospholipase/carboxylesterase